jgi:hypothetical protein
MWTVLVIVAQLAFALGAQAQLHMPVFSAGTNTYTNAIITAAATGDRILIQHPLGMAAFPVAELDLATREQLLEARLVSQGMAKQIEKELRKRDAALRKAERGPAEAPEISLDDAQKTSLANLVGQQAKWQANERDVQFNWAWLLENFGAAILYGVLAGFLALKLLRYALLYRIHKKSTGKGSLLVFIPILQWWPLLSAAKMSKHWLLIPLFVLAAFFAPPPVPADLEWAGKAWLTMMALLWFAVIVFYVVWCVKLCRAVEHSGWLAILLLLPVLDYVALGVLAFRGGSRKAAAAPDLAKRPAFAI